jgi:hypothetical protein
MQPVIFQLLIKYYIKNKPSIWPKQYVCRAKKEKIKLPYLPGNISIFSTLDMFTSDYPQTSLMRPLINFSSVC